MQAPQGMVSRVNDAVADSIVGRWFSIKDRRTTFTTELRAGLVTFLSLSYIMAVNSLIIGETGGPCSVSDCTGTLAGKPACVFPDAAGNSDPGYGQCLTEFKKSLVTATAASSLIGSFLMGFGANLPIAVAPGMGLNAYFTYNVVGYRGTGNVSYQTALAALLIEGILFVILAVTGVRTALIKLIPRCLVFSTSAGIGLFLAFIGLQTSEGLGVVTYDSATLVALGGCPLGDQIPQYTISEAELPGLCSVLPDGTAMAELPPVSNSYSCITGKMTSAATWLGLAGMAIIAGLMQRNIKGAVLLGILFVTVVAWIPGHAASYLGSTGQYVGGEERLDYFKKVVDVPKIRNTGAAYDFSGFTTGNLWIALVTFLYTDFIDTTGTLYSLCNFIGTFLPGFVNEKKEFPRMTFAFCVDGFSIIVGSLMGTSPLTAYVESANGIREGGRTGITACVVSFCFFVSLFFTPIFSNVPPYGIGPALIIVGSLMMANATKINWGRTGDAVPAFLTIAIMPLTYSIAYGLIAGVVSYMIINFTDFAIVWVARKAGLQLQDNPGVIDEAAIDMSLHPTRGAPVDPAATHVLDDSAHASKLDVKKLASMELPSMQPAGTESLPEGPIRNGSVTVHRSGLNGLRGSDMA